MNRKQHQIFMPQAKHFDWKAFPSAFHIYILCHIALAQHTHTIELFVARRAEIRYNLFLRTTDQKEHEGERKITGIFPNQNNGREKLKTSLSRRAGVDALKKSRTGVRHFNFCSFCFVQFKYLHWLMELGGKNSPGRRQSMEICLYWRLLPPPTANWYQIDITMCVMETHMSVQPDTAPAHKAHSIICLFPGRPIELEQRIN